MALKKIKIVNYWKQVLLLYDSIYYECNLNKRVVKLWRNIMFVNLVELPEL